MKRKPVESSMLQSVGYGREKRILELEFTSGQVYQYFDVPNSLYKDLMDASSHGSYFNAYIKDAYDFIRVGMG